MLPKQRIGSPDGERRGADGAGRIRRQFEEAVGRVSNWDGPAVTPKNQLALYGLYKQSCFGDCRSQRPGLFDATGRAKWDSWKSCEGLDDTEAIRRYCRIADAVCPKRSAECGDVNARMAEVPSTTGTEGALEPAPARPPRHVSRKSRVDEDFGDEDDSQTQLGAERSTKRAPADAATVLLSSPRDCLDPVPGEGEGTGVTAAAAAAAEGGMRGQSLASKRRAGGGEGRSTVVQPGDCFPGLCLSGSESSATGGVGGCAGLELAGVSMVAAAVVLLVVVALASSGDRGADGREGQHGLAAAVAGTADTAETAAAAAAAAAAAFSGGVWRLAGAWPRATAFAVAVILALTAATAVAAAAAGCLWCAVRVARWREEIFAGSPVVAEALSRAAALERDSEGSDKEHASPAAESRKGLRSSDSSDSCICSIKSNTSSSRSSSSGSSGSSGPTTVGRSGGGSSRNVSDDPIANIFRPGTRAWRDFYTPSPTIGTARLRGSRGSANAGPTTAEEAGDTEGVAVFLTGVTGLVGQMVLYDLLRQGAAVPPSTTTLDVGGRGLDTGGDHSRSGGGPAPRNLRRVMVLVRRKKGVSPSDRLASIRDSPMFRPLRERGVWADGGENGGGGTLVTAVEGELGTEGLGLTAESRALLAGAGVTHALHCAASVSFSDPLAEAAATNVTGALRVAALAASWPSCGTLVHVSTAFVHGGKCGTPSCPLPQELPDLGGRNPERLYRSARNAPSSSPSGVSAAGSVLGFVQSAAGVGAGAGGGAGKEAMDAMADLGYPNTYTFTKALGEHLLTRALSAHNRKLHALATGDRGGGGGGGGEGRCRRLVEEAVGGSGAYGGASSSASSSCPCRLRLRIVRPSIVGPSWMFPWPGWTGEQPSTVTGCQVLVLQRAVKTFRLGPHPAPIIPVDVVSRAIVHSALGWGGPPTTTTGGAATATYAVAGAAVDATPRRPLRPSRANAGALSSSSAATSCPEVVIRNLAWATHPLPGGRDSGGGAAAVARRNACGGTDGDAGSATCGGRNDETDMARGAPCARPTEHASERSRVDMNDGESGVEREGRMPSFREISGLLYDYAVLRGLRPSLEALAMRSSFAAASIPPAPLAAGQGEGEESRRQHSGGRPLGVWSFHPPSRLVFESMHMLLDRFPVWALQGLAALAERLGVFCFGRAKSEGGGGVVAGAGAGAVATLKRLDKLATLPAVYETFTWRQYFFESALRVPGDLTPEGYALETALASELLQRSLLGGSAVGAKASADRRCAILTELGLQIRTHRSGGLRCGGVTGGRSTTGGCGVREVGFTYAGGDPVDGGGGGGGATVVTRNVGKNKDQDGGHRGRRALTHLCGRADRLAPWPALAWWAATLPGSAARGGITVWVRLVAFAVRVVMSRAASLVAVDVESFRAAAPPGHYQGAAAAGGGGDVKAEDVEPPRRRGPGDEEAVETGAVVQRGEELKEDGAVLFSVLGGGEASSAGGVKDTIDRVEGGAGSPDLVDAAGGHEWQSSGRQAEERGERCSGVGRSPRGKVIVVLLPTHRSYLDFVLVSLFCASMRSSPGLSWLRVPKVAAADGHFGTEGSPLRWIMAKLGAFFVRRGRKGEPHAFLRRRLEALQESDGGLETPECARYLSPGADGTPPGSTSAASARNLEGHGCSGDDAARRACINGWEQAKGSGGPNKRIRDQHHQGADFSHGTRSGLGGGWPGPCETDPRQMGMETLEVFVEGTRSRDRRFLPPKTGLIKALQRARKGATLWLVPVSISYERVPEQASLAEELVGSRDGDGGQQLQQQPVGAVGLTGLLRWTVRALSGRVRLGRVLMRAEDPVVLRPGGDVRAALLEVRRRHRLGTVVTPYHIREAVEHLGLDEEDVRECVEELGGTVWDEVEEDGGGQFDEHANPFAQEQQLRPMPPPKPPSRYASDVPAANRREFAAEPASSDKEAWMNHLQWLHLLEGRLRASSSSSSAGNREEDRKLARWADWLLPPPPPPTTSAGSAAAAAAAAAATLARGHEAAEEGEKEKAEAGAGSLLGQGRAASSGADGSSSSGANVVGDMACDGGVYVTIPDRVASLSGGSGSTTSETLEMAGTNSPRSTESSSPSSSPSWEMAAGASMASSSSSSSSSPSSFEMTPSLDGDGGAPAVEMVAAAAPSSPASSSLDPTLSVESSSLSAGDHNNDRGGSKGRRAELSEHKDNDPLCPPIPRRSSPASHPAASGRVLAAVLREIDRAERAVAEARQALLDKGFVRPSRGHVLQALLRRAAIDDVDRDRAEDPGKGTDVPSSFLASVALSLRDDDGVSAGASIVPQGGSGSSVAPAATVSRQPGSGGDAEEDSWFGAVDGDREAIGSWGFRDSGFCIESDRADGGDPYVVMRGNRYGICGRPLRGLLPFVREAVGVPISAAGRSKRAASPPPPSLPPSRLLQPKPLSLDTGPGIDRTGKREIGEEDELGDPLGRTLFASMVEALGPSFDSKEQVTFSRQERARHGAGHGLLDIWSIRTGRLRRAPDAVVWPSSEDEVTRLMEWAGQEGVCLIPFGGGTSVTRALEVPPLEVEPRPVVSVDMRKMCRVLDVDVANGTAHIQAGIVGRKMSEQLADKGVTMGHEPDSLEFSTLGGWVATRASGMKRGRYGNIEDMVLEVRVVTGRGLAWQHCDRAEARPKAAGAFSRTSVGLDLASAMLGSEGCLGIVTSVVVKVVPLPAVSEHASFLFRDFQTGVAFCRELSRSSGRLGLASCRLLDNRQLRLGKAMKGDEQEGLANGPGATLTTLVSKAVSKAKSAYISLWKGWDWKETSAVTLVFEGSQQEAALQRSEVSRIARAHCGLSGGASAGKSGYDLTFAIAYLRDFALLFDVLGESFETFVSWTALEGLCEKVRDRVRKEHRERGLRGEAFITHRVTQLYPEGACVYFYLAIYAEGVRNPTEIFAELEEAARDEILLAGGSLSHHHGIGKSRAGFMPRVCSPVVSDLVIGMKRALDPHNILVARNNVLSTEASASEGGRAAT